MTLRNLEGKINFTQLTLTGARCCRPLQEVHWMGARARLPKIEWEKIMKTHRNGCHHAFFCIFFVLIFDELWTASRCIGLLPVDGIGDLAGGPPARRSEGKLQLQRSEEFVWGSDQSAPENCIKTKLFFPFTIYEAGIYLDHFLESKKVVQVAVFEGMNYSCHVALFITLIFSQTFCIMRTLSQYFDMSLLDRFTSQLAAQWLLDSLWLFMYTIY